MKRRSLSVSALAILVISSFAVAPAHAGSRATAPSLRFVFEAAVVELVSNDVIGVSTLTSANPAAGAPLKAGYFTFPIMQAPPSLGATVRVAGVIRFASMTDKQAFLAGQCTQELVCVTSASAAAPLITLPQAAITVSVTPSRHVCKESSITSPAITQRVRVCRVNNRILSGVYEPALSAKNAVWITVNNVTRLAAAQRNTMVSIGSSYKQVTLRFARRDVPDGPLNTSSVIKI
jgi:hypothetical protein